MRGERRCAAGARSPERASVPAEPERGRTVGGPTPARGSLRLARSWWPARSAVPAPARRTSSTREGGAREDPGGARPATRVARGSPD
jgi:hypothetical protein